MRWEEEEEELAGFTWCKQRRLGAPVEGEQGGGRREGRGGCRRVKCCRERGLYAGRREERRRVHSLVRVCTWYSGTT